MQAMTNGIDVFVVEKPADLPQMLADYYDDETRRWGELCGWSILPGTHPLTKMFDTSDFSGSFGPQAGDLPDGSFVELFDGSYFVTAPVAQWISFQGKGLLLTSLC